MQTDVVPSELPADAANAYPTDGQSIGDIIRANNHLTPDQVERILSYQVQHGVKFGEAAVKLGFVGQEDVTWALAKQFDYHYASGDSRHIADEVVVAKKPFSDQSEIFRATRGHLMDTVFHSNTPEKVALSVLSPHEGDGKSYFVANIATALSQLGARTLIVDADLRKPRQHEIFGIESKSGLSGILSGRAENKLIHPVEDLPTLYILPAGVVPPNPMELVQRPTFGQLLADLKKKFDYIIVDTPSASLGTDGRVVASHCGAALAICRRNKTRMDAMQAMLAPLTISNHIRLAGVLINEY